jgi:hypothetical protein
MSDLSRELREAAEAAPENTQIWGAVFQQICSPADLLSLLAKADAAEGLAAAVERYRTSDGDSEHVLYYSPYCPHCLALDDVFVALARFRAQEDN